MAEDLALDLEELRRLQSIAKRPSIVNLISDEIRNLEKVRTSSLYTYAVRVLIRRFSATLCELRLINTVCMRADVCRGFVWMSNFLKYRWKMGSQKLAGRWYFPPYVW